LTETPTARTSAISTTPDAGAAVLAALTSALGEGCSTDQALREEKGHDRSFHPWEPPLAVVQPRSTEEVATALRICGEHGVPVVPRGSGTGVEGGSNTTAGSISLDLSQMDQILEVAADDMYARVQAGVMKSALNRELAPHGMSFPVGPGVDASVGGMASTSASGTTAVSYGTLKENVIGLTAVMADGSVITTGGITAKSSAGYDLTHLLVGAEGTLGVITEVTVRSHPIPEYAAVSIWSLPSLAAASELVVAALRSSLRPARVELLDDTQVDALVRYTDLELPVAHTLMVEFEGGEDDVAARTAKFGRLAETYSAHMVASAQDPEGAARIWQARHDAFPACLALLPDPVSIVTDVCVPLSSLVDCIAETKKDIDDASVLAPIVGHVGDGNFHLIFVLPRGDQQALETARQVNERMVQRALDMGGTCTGEHGIGMGKVGSLAQEHPSAAAVARTIKDALDPQDILNPGKVAPRIR